MDRPGRGETAGLCESARAFIGNCAPWSIQTLPQEVEEPVPRAVGGERFESREAGRAGTPSITVPGAEFDDDPPATPASELEEIQKYLPEGSVYLWAAMVDGAAATDAIAGWIVLMAQISFYILILVNSPQRGIEQLQEDSIIHVPIEGDHTTSGYTLDQIISDDATTIRVVHSTESISYALSSISAAIYLVLTFAAGDLRAAFALLQTRKLYNMILGGVTLASFVLLVLASLSILFFLAEDNASFVVGAAAVLFISDLDEKLWTALQTVSARSRLFWCIEAFAASLVLAIAGIAWFGNTGATDPGGINAGVNATETWTPVLFEPGFVFLIAPIGATVGAWIIALFLQYVAERYTRTDAVRPRNLGNFIFLNALVIGHWRLSFIYGILYWVMVSPLVVWLAAAPVVLSAAAGVAMCFPCCTKYVSRGRLKMFVGIGVGYLISVGHTKVLHQVYYYMRYKTWFVDDYVLAAFDLALSLLLAVSLVKAIGQSFESYPADMRALTWRLKCCGTTDSTGNRDDEADPTIFGTALVVWSLYTCVFFVIVLASTVNVGSVMF